MMISYSITVLSLYTYLNKCTKHDHDVHHVQFYPKLLIRIIVPKYFQHDTL